MQAHRATRNRNLENSLGVSDQIRQPLIIPFGGSFFPSSADLWNVIPESIRNEPNLLNFSKGTTEYMWNNLMAQYDLEPN